MIQRYEVRPSNDYFEVWRGNKYCGRLDNYTGPWTVVAHAFCADYPTKARAITAIVLSGWHR